ncbi:protein phosphatase 2C domain-containing protein [Pseudomonas gingeri]|uniref:Protein phosphatase 2C domain-containing protein n=1 Tax=Pseudomonas gingeri TaxID=117681 RepID=A0A7Y7X7G8_9PSED|nr:protein phosphatase 2C domain-containing protein [Pseudomonas gingeri]NWB94416.1 protein phosphatase 2C domain-containing protein [Pseudomonas gingeri]
MRGNLQWRTLSGTLTADNRDAFAHIDQAHVGLYLIADGSSSHPYSGELAKALIAQLTLSFKSLPVVELNAQQLAATLLRVIANSRQTLREEHPVAACSYLLLCLLGETAFSIHEGDCCLGLIQPGGKVNWLSSVHCAPNWQGTLSHAEIARQPSRHRLTRCFSARRVSNPEINYWPVSPSQHWLLASDGFWASLSSEEQLTFMHGGDLPTPPSDDITYLSVVAPPT